MSGLKPYRPSSQSRGGRFRRENGEKRVLISQLLARQAGQVISTSSLRKRKEGRVPRSVEVRLLLTERFPRDRELDLAWRRDVVETSVWALLSVGGYRQSKGFNGNRNERNYLSTMERGKLEPGAEILLRICSTASVPADACRHGDVPVGKHPPYGLRRSLEVSGLPRADSAASFVEQTFVVAEADFA